MFTDEKAHYEHRYRHYWRIVRAYPYELESVSEKYLDKKMCLMAVKRCPSVFALVPEHLRNSAMARVAMAADPKNLHRFVPRHLMTASVLRLAVKFTPNFLRWIPGLTVAADGVDQEKVACLPLTDDEKAVITAIAVRRNGTLITRVPSEARTDHLFRCALCASVYAGAGCPAGYSFQHFEPEMRTIGAEMNIELLRLMASLVLPMEMKEELIAATSDVAYYFRNCLSSAELEEQQLTQADLCQLPFKDPDFKFGRALVV